VNATLARLEEVVCTVPDPTVDRDALLVFADPTSHATQCLARRLSQQREWCRLSIGDLLPGLSILESRSFTDRLNRRASNGLAREGIRTWGALGRMTPGSLLALSGIGPDTVDEILIVALGEWARAYLAADDSNGFSTKGSHDIGKGPRADPLASPSETEALDALLGRVPDPLTDHQLLMTLRDRDHRNTEWLAIRLHTDKDLQRWPLRELLPGLDLIDAPTFSDRLSVRAANCVLRAEVGTLGALAQMTPASILGLPNLGPKTGEEILAALISEWTSAYLRRWGGH
jgi:Bacterial RNA polymerase, alpha chain C terminal domain